MNNGWIKLFQSILDWEWYNDVPVFKLWIHILLRANWKDNRWQGEVIAKGSFATSVSKLAVETGLTDKQVRLALNKLEKTGEIATKRTNKNTLICVNKWDEYQGAYVTEGKQKDTQRCKQTDKQRGSERATNEDIKKRRREEYIYKGFSPEFTQALNDFKEMRKKIKKPLTDKATEMMLVKLSKLAVDEETQIEILNQSTMNCWQSVYPLDTQKSISREKRGLEALMDL